MISTGLKDHSYIVLPPAWLPLHSPHHRRLSPELELLLLAELVQELQLVLRLRVAAVDLVAGERGHRQVGVMETGAGRHQTEEQQQHPHHVVTTVSTV